MGESTTTLDILKDLIRIDTQNPPGNEHALVAYLHAWCERLDLDHTVYSYGEGRDNILIRMGKPKGRNLVVLGHMDVVVADPESWCIPPFAGEVKDGYLYGRGTLDMKYFIAASLSTMETLKQLESLLDRQVVFLFTADEETGSAFGLPRVLEEPGVAELLADSVVLNEGGGFALFKDGSCHYLYETGQKSVGRLRVSVRRLADSNPYFPSMEHERIMVEVIDRLQGLQIDTSIPDTVVSLRKAFMDHSCGDSKLNRLIDTMSSSMVTATMVEGGSRNLKLADDVKVQIDFDCRLLPNVEKSEFEKKIETALSGLPVTHELLRFSPGYEARIDDALVELLTGVLRRHEPEVDKLLPFITPGSNDGKYLRSLGCDVVGFAPLAKNQTFTDIMPLIHGVDERISLESIEFCALVLRDVCIEYLTGDSYHG
jgi:acetylornithine deacetylase/succinyl-diaminopimelate desuccinylase-like protein